MDNNDEKDKFKQIEKWSNKITAWSEKCSKIVNNLTNKQDTNEKRIKKLELDLKKANQNLINITRQYNNTLRQIKQLEHDNRNMKQDLDQNSKVLQSIVKAMK